MMDPDESEEMELGMRDVLPFLDFSPYFEDARKDGENVWRIDSINVMEDGELWMILKNVTVTLENARVATLAYTVDIGAGVTVSYTLALSLYGEIDLDVSPSMLKKLMVIRELEEFFMGEDEVWRNYSSKEILSAPGSSNVQAENVYLFDNGAVSYNGMASGSPSAAMTYLYEDAFCLLFMLYADDFIYDPDTDSFFVQGPLEFYPASVDYAVATSITFRVEEGLLTSLSYVAEYWVYPEDAEEPEMDMERFVQKTYYDYGTTEVDAAPMPAGTYGTVKSFLEAPTRTVSFSRASDYGRYSAEVLYYANGTMDYQANDNGEESTGELASGNVAELWELDSFVDYIRNLSEADFIMAHEEFYYVGESVYEEYLLPDELSIVIGDGIMRVTFFSGEETILLHVLVGNI